MRISVNVLSKIITRFFDCQTFLYLNILLTLLVSPPHVCELETYVKNLFNSLETLVNESFVVNNSRILSTCMPSNFSVREYVHIDFFSSSVFKNWVWLRRHRCVTL